jgi:hypothetical protein
MKNTGILGNFGRYSRKIKKRNAPIVIVAFIAI